ncbi:pantoate--beta-alanine ligase [bacterium]|nr:pantoate--beta-alanine ligase [bacterium]NBX81791.1 pantoate--beta-alanine ligase [bacterium]
MLVLKTVREAQEALGPLKNKNTLALVPTMGCLHQGHLALAHRAREVADKVVVSIFVNPLQFGPHEDFAQYPRTFEADKKMLEEIGVDYLFHPEASDLYPPGFASTLRTGAIAEILCGRFRPGHFDGVATVCMKLFQITHADFAVFGEKDYQQLQVIRQTVRDLNVPVTLLPHATVREADGLALSSRNRYLSPVERKLASQVPEALRAIQTQARKKPETSVRTLLELGHQALQSLEVQYLEITSGPDLKPAAPQMPLSALREPRTFLAVKIGKTRLIDNMSLEVPV